MAITREQAIAEAKARGLNIPAQPIQAEQPAITREQALAEAQARGIVPSQQQPVFNETAMSATQPTLGDKFANLQERASRALGLGGAPIVTGGPIGAFAAKEFGKLKQGVKEEGARFVGETIGEAVGSKFGLKGRAIGAGLGRATGESITQIAQAIVDSPNAPKTSKEAALRILKEGSIAVGTEIVSDKVLGSVRRLAASLGFRSSTIKPLPDFDDVQRLAKNLNIDLTAAQRTASRSIDTLEEVAENAFFGRGPLRDIKQIDQPAGIRRGVDRLLDSFLSKNRRVGQGELGDILGDVIQKKNKAFRKTGGVLYDAVDRATRPSIETKSVFIDVPSIILDASGKPVQRTVRKEVQQEVGGALTNISGIKKVALQIQKQRLKEGGPRTAVDDIVDNVLSRPNSVNFKTAHNIRSDFLEIQRNAPSKKDRIAGIAGSVAKTIDRQMSIAADNLSPTAKRLWRSANSFWKGGKQIFDSKVVRRVTKSILDDTPDKVLDVVFQGKSPKQIKTIMGLADPLTRDRLRFAFLDNMLSKSTRQIPGDISDLRTLIGRNFLEKFDSFGDDALNAVFSKDEKNRIRTLARLAKTTQGKTGGAGGFLVQLIQAAPLGATATGVLSGQPGLTKKGLVTGIPIAGFTAGLSKLIRSPSGSKILTDMMNVPKGTKEFAALSARLTRELARSGFKENQAEQRRRRGGLRGRDF